ncbi:MAG TPA: LD-carboxypeptidase [Bacilli bacterium]|nr:LD-carboxypeptidase [Bacilli bacterium]
MQKQKPKMLKKGDTIGIVCPSYTSTMKDRESTFYHKLQQLGFKIKLGKTCFLQQGYLAGSDQERADDLMSMFLDPEVDGIIALLGGYGASRMVDKLDYEKLKSHPKLLMGFSDITVLLNAINQQSNIPTAHGIVGTFLGSPNSDIYTEMDFSQFLLTNDLRVLENPLKDAITYINGTASGEVVGGNLSLIDTLLGTPYEIDFKDKIILIEDVGEEPYRIDRMFSKLRLSGKLSQAAGFILGTFTDCLASSSKRNYQTTQDIIDDYIKPLNKPTIMNFATGHSFPFTTVPIGIEVKLDADAKTITYLERFFKE